MWRDIRLSGFLCLTNTPWQNVAEVPEWVRAEFDEVTDLYLLTQVKYVELGLTEVRMKWLIVDEEADHPTRAGER